MTDLPTADTIGHFDRRETLQHLLVNHAPPLPEVATAADYAGWASSERQAFDDRRKQRIADSIVVETPAIKELTIECRRAALFSNRAIGRTGVILSGPPTMGKTTAAFRAMVDAFARHARRHPDWEALGHTPVVYVEVPPKCNGKNIMGRFLHFFGVPVLPRMTLEERTQLVTELLTKAQTSLVVIDEFQNLSGITSTGRFESAQAIKNLMNSLKAVPLYVGFNLEKGALTNNDLGAQFASRSALVRLDKLSVSTAEGRKLWGGVIVGFERQFALLNHPERTLLPLAEYLYHRTRGSIGALSRLLTIAALDLIEAGDPSSETITRELLDTIKLDLTTERELDQARDRKGGAKNPGGRRAA